MRLIILLLCCISIVSCHTSTKKHSDKMIFRYNESAGIQTFDPAFAKDQARVWFCNHIYNSLVQLDSNLNIQPSIAKSWKISSDALAYEFTIRQDVTFHKPIARSLHISDIIYSLNRLKSSHTASPGAWVLSDVATIKALNDSTLYIGLKESNPAFLGLLSMPYCSIIPKESDSTKDFFKKPVGTGPFQFQYHKPNVKLVLRKNDSYFEQDKGIKLPYLDAVAISFIPDKQTAFLEFIKGNFDFLSGIDASYKDELIDSHGALKEKYSSHIHYTKQDYLNTEYLGILLDKNQSNIALKDKRVRQALNLSFDKELMMKFLRNNIGTPAINGFIPKGLQGFNESKTYSYNLQKARRLLADAGYPNAVGIPQIELSTTSSYVDLCEYIQHAWQELGLEVTININPPSTHRQQVSKGQLSIFRGSWIADYADAENYLSLFYTENHSPNGPNYTRFSNVEFDNLYKKAKSSTRLEDRVALYQQMDSIIMNEAAIIPLYYDNVSRFTHKNINGLGSNPMNLLDLKRVTLK